MTLTRLLGIDRSLIKHEDDRGLRLAEDVWKSQGAPSEGPALTDAIESTLQRCTQEGIPYPAILLKRKKQLERGTWLPAPEGGSPAGDPLLSEGDSNCPQCGGSGHILIEGGRHAKMCKCNKWMRAQRVQ